MTGTFKVTTAFSALALMAALAACGGGTGPNMGGPPPINPPATATPCPAADTGSAPNCVNPQGAMTNASGVLVDDPSGSPLAGIAVKLEPWGSGPPCTGTPSLTTYGQDGCPTPLPSPQVTTAPNGDFTLDAVPNGQYLLVIGSDSPTDTTRPTIHDNVMLTGGNQTLHAPTLPPIPTITPPAAETNGDYRLLTLDPVGEAPCLTDFNAARASLNLPPVVEDEWLTENDREANAFHITPGYYHAPWPGNPVGALTSYSPDSGELSQVCQDGVNEAFNGDAAASKSPQQEWFGGNIAGPYSVSGSTGYIAQLEIPLDPRSAADPSGVVWP